jgi:hypothetical protein
MEKYELWTIPWKRKLFTSENIHWKGDGVSCVKLWLGMSCETCVIDGF